MLQQPLTPIIIRVAEPATESITVSDVLVGVFSFTGVVAASAVTLAVIFAAVLIALRHRRKSNPANGADQVGTSLGLHLPSN